MTVYKKMVLYTVHQEYLITIIDRHAFVACQTFFMMLDVLAQAPQNEYLQVSIWQTQEMRGPSRQGRLQAASVAAWLSTESLRLLCESAIAHQAKQFCQMSKMAIAAR